MALLYKLFVNKFLLLCLKATRKCSSIFSAIIAVLIPVGQVSSYALQSQMMGRREQGKTFFPSGRLWGMALVKPPREVRSVKGKNFNAITPVTAQFSQGIKGYSFSVVIRMPPTMPKFQCLIFSQCV